MGNHILLTVILAVFTALLGVGIIIPILPLLATKLGASGFSLGVITAAFSLSRGIWQPMVGNLSDRWGRKGFLVAGLFIYGVVGLLIPWAANVGQLVAIRLLQGFGAAMVVPVAMAYASFLAPPGQEGRTMALLNIAIFCGIGCGPVLGGLVADNWGMAMVFHLMALLCFLAVVLVWRTLPSCSPIERQQPLSLGVQMRAMLHRRRTKGILLARFATVLMMVPTMAFLPVLMTNRHGSSGFEVGLVIACRTLMNAALQYPFGLLADRYDKVVLLVAGCLAMTIALLAIPMMGGFWGFMGMYLFLGLGEAVLWPVLGAYAAEEGRTHFGHGTMMGVFNLAMSAGVFTGALLAGASMDWLGMQQAFILTGAAVCVLGVGAAGLIRRGEREEEASSAQATGSAPG